jgi:hypothetical protein
MGSARQEHTQLWRRPFELPDARPQSDQPQEFEAQVKADNMPPGKFWL